MSPDALSSAFYEEVRRRGLPEVSLKGLRSTFATMHAEIGTPLIVASRAMGHSTIKTTADLYTRVPDSLQIQAATNLEKAFSQARYKNVTRKRGKK